MKKGPIERLIRADFTEKMIFFWHTVYFLLKVDSVPQVAHYDIKLYLFPVVSLIGHNQEPAIINEIAEEVLQTTRHSLHHSVL